eukprot:g20587.t1
MDANAQTGSKIAVEDEGNMGEIGRIELNGNGRRLLTFATDNRLAVPNTFFDKRRDGIWHTYNDPARDDCKCLNYILTRQSHRGRVSSMEVVPPPIRPVRADPDHNIVVATVDLGGRLAHNRPIRISLKRQFNRHDLHVEAARWAASQRFLCNLLTRPGALAATAQEMVEEFTEALFGGAETELSEEPRRRRSLEWNMTAAVRAALAAALDKRRAARHGFKASPNAATFRILKAACKRVEATIATSIYDHLERGISLLSHVGKVLAKTITNHLSAFCEANDILREELRIPAWPVHGVHAIRCAPTPGAGAEKENPALHVLHRPAEGHDSVDRELLWKVLARVGIPAEMFAVIRKFVVGMRARVCMDDGDLSDWFSVTQGLRQGCSMSPLLFTVFFAAPLEVIVTRFSQDEVIMRDQVYLEEEGGGGVETLLDRVRRAVWGMLCAIDAGVVSKSAEGLARMITIIVEGVFREFGLTVSERKTETLVMWVKEKQTPLPLPPQLLLRVIGHLRKRGTHRQLSYTQALKRVVCQSVEATIRQRRLFFAGAVARQPDKRLLQRLMFGELAGGEKPGKGSPE